MPFKMTKFLVEELEHYISHNVDVSEDEDADDREAFAAAAVALRAVLQGRELTPEQREIAQRELLDAEDRYSGVYLRQWQNLEAHLGFLSVYESDATYSRRPRTRVIEGVRYIVG